MQMGVEGEGGCSHTHPLRLHLVSSESTDTRLPNSSPNGHLSGLLLA